LLKRVMFENMTLALRLEFAIGQYYAW
jgi:hypothetical protein